MRSSRKQQADVEEYAAKALEEQEPRDQPQAEIGQSAGEPNRAESSKVVELVQAPTKRTNTKKATSQRADQRTYYLSASVAESVSGLRRELWDDYGIRGSVVLDILVGAGLDQVPSPQKKWVAGVALRRRTEDAGDVMWRVSDELHGHLEKLAQQWNGPVRVTHSALLEELLQLGVAQVSSVDAILDAIAEQSS